jgi:3-isopropylmalate dehydratase small subunit
LSHTIEGRLYKLGDNVNSDVIIPGRYLIYVDPMELAKHAFEVLGEGFPEKLRGFSLLVAGENFGCGSAREQAVTAIQGLGIRAIVAKSFARTFFRNAINRGLPIIECPQIYDGVEEGDPMVIELGAGLIRAGERRYEFPRLPESVQRILDAGGLTAYLRAQGNIGTSAGR